MWQWIDCCPTTSNINLHWANECLWERTGHSHFSNLSLFFPVHGRHIRIRIWVSVRWHKSAECGGNADDISTVINVYTLCDVQFKYTPHAIFIMTHIIIRLPLQPTISSNVRTLNACIFSTMRLHLLASQRLQCHRMTLTAKLMTIENNTIYECASVSKCRRCICGCHAKKKNADHWKCLQRAHTKLTFGLLFTPHWNSVVSDGLRGVRNWCRELNPTKIFLYTINSASWINSTHCWRICECDIIKTSLCLHSSHFMPYCSLFAANEGRRRRQKMDAINSAASTARSQKWIALRERKLMKIRIIVNWGYPFDDARLVYVPIRPIRILAGQFYGHIANIYETINNSIGKLLLNWKKSQIMNTLRSLISIQPFKPRPRPQRFIRCLCMCPYLSRRPLNGLLYLSDPNCEAIAGKIYGITKPAQINNLFNLLIAWAAANRVWMAYIYAFISNEL